MMQARWGSHGDYEIIALSPNSPQECFDLMIEAFNLSEEFRTPVLFMMDESVGHMTEKVTIPPADEIEITPRRFTNLPPGQYQPYQADADGVPPMVRTGRGHHFHTTGLTHDEHGYPAMNAETQQKLIRRLVEKIRKNADRIVRYEENFLDDAELIVVAYGITARVALRAVQMARERGVAAGLLRLIVAWPFPEKRIRELAARPGMLGFVVPELNLGQMALEVERCAAGRVPTVLLPHGGGTVHRPEEVLETILQTAAVTEVQR